MNLVCGARRTNRISNGPLPAPESDAMRLWASRQREMLLEDRLDRLTAALERLVLVLERRAS